MTRKKADHEKLHPGTGSADEWLLELAKYQEEYGWGTLPPKSCYRDGHLRQWVERMRRMANSGRVPVTLAIHLARCGILLSRDPEKVNGTSIQAEAAFRRNMQALRDWMCAKAGWMRGEVDITYADTRTGLACRRSYTFLEHMRLKLNQTLLPEHHLEELLRLPLRINGQLLGVWLDADHALRDEAMCNLEPVYGPCGKRSRLLTKEETMEHYAAFEGGYGVIYFDGNVHARDEDGTRFQQKAHVGAKPVQISGCQVMLLDTGDSATELGTGHLDIADCLYRFKEDGPGAPVIIYNQTSLCYGVLAIRDAPRNCIGRIRPADFYQAALERKYPHAGMRSFAASL